MTRGETLERLAAVALLLRPAQRRYFQTRDRATLVEAKRLEAVFDACLRELEADRRATQLPLEEGEA